MNLVGTYSGIVAENRDPEKLGRLKVRVPVVYGVSGPAGEEIGIDKLPWAMPTGLPAGGSIISGGIDWVPNVNDSVWVRFLDGEPEKPIWEWGMQNRSQASAMGVHQYDSENSAPFRTGLTRFGHTIEFTLDGLVVTTAGGQQVTLSDTAKSVAVIAKNSTVMSADNAVINANSDALVRVGRSFTVMANGVMLTIKEQQVVLTTKSGAALIIDSDGNVALTSSDGTALGVEKEKAHITLSDGTSILLSKGNVTVNGAEVAFNAGSIGFGTTAAFGVVLAELLVAAFNSHLHSNGNNGAPTGPPIVPLTTEQVKSKVLLSA